MSGMLARCLAVSVVVFMTACGQPAESPTPQSNGSADDGLLTCAGPPFDRDVFDRPTNAEAGTSPEAAALREILEDGRLTSGAGWRELGRSDDQVAFGRGEPPVLEYVVLRRQGDGWKFTQSGDGCVVSPHRPSFETARWGLDPEHDGPTEESTELHVIVNDHSCSSGVGPDKRLQDPIVEVDDEQLVVTFYSRTAAGDQSCPSHPPVKRKVELGTKLGRRTLRDGGIYPPQPPCRIDDLGDCVNIRDEVAAARGEGGSESP